MSDHLNEFPPLIEGDDYYVDEDGLLVFTKQHLLKRGFCCHQGCRHCPYEDSKPPSPSTPGLPAKKVE